MEGVQDRHMAKQNKYSFAGFVKVQPTVTGGCLREGHLCTVCCIYKYTNDVKCVVHVGHLRMLRLEAILHMLGVISYI